MRAQRVDKVLITDGTEAASVAALGPLDYVVLVEGKAANTPIDSGDKFQIVVEKSNGLVKYSDRIKADDIVSVRLEEYAAVVEQVVTVVAAAPTAGLEYLLTIVDKSDKEVLQRRQDKRTYQYTAKTGDDAAAVATAFRDKINSDEAAPVVASGSGANIVLTAKAKVTVENAAGQFGLQHYFEVGAQEVNLYGHYVPYGTITYTTAPNFGNGTYPHVRALEQWSAGYDEGIYLNRTLFPVPQPAYDSVPGTNYDLIVIKYDNVYNTNSVVFGKRVADPITLVLAVTAGSTGDLETIFANYIVD